MPLIVTLPTRPEISTSSSSASLILTCEKLTVRNRAPVKSASRNCAFVRTATPRVCTRSIARGQPIGAAVLGGEIPCDRPQEIGATLERLVVVDDAVERRRDDDIAHRIGQRERCAGVPRVPERGGAHRVAERVLTETDHETEA